MPTTAAALMNRLLGRFMQVLSAGYANTVGEVFALMLQIMAISLIVSAIWWGFTRQPVLKELFWKLLGFAFLLWIVTDWVHLGKDLRDTFIQWGLNVGRNVLTVKDITEPG